MNNLFSESQEVNLDTGAEYVRLKKKVGVLKVYNYYRVMLSFALLMLFLQVPDQQLVGTEFPELFQLVILGYIGINIATSFVTLFLKVEKIASTLFLLITFSLDIVLLSLLMYASGGVGSGMGNFLVFPVAFAGVLIVGKMSTMVAAISIILSIYCELNIFLLKGAENQEVFFKLGLLGGVLFAVNILFQYVSSQLRRKEEEFTTLEILSEAQRAAEEAMYDSNARFEALLNSAGEGVLGLDLDGNISFANPKAASLLEMDTHSLVGESIRKYVLAELSDSDEASDDIRTDEISIINYLIENGRDKQDRKPDANRWQTDDGKGFVVEYTCETTTHSDGEAAGAVVIFQDISRRKENEERLNYLANYDPMTGLSNRLNFEISLDKSMARSQRSKNELAVMLLDLDHFKYVNDNYGHDIGDALLVEVSRRIESCIRKGDTAARLGGDEFGILLLDFHTVRNVELIAKNILQEICQPYELSGNYFSISTSIGISIYDHSEMTLSELLKSADTAMYESKSKGRNAYCVYQHEMEESAAERQNLLMQLQKAIQKNEFKLHYQPIYSLLDNSIVSSEAFIRWKLDTGESVGPNVFIPLAEKHGKIDEIGDWVLRTVFEQIHNWHKHLDIYPRVAINISARQLRTDHFRKQIERHLKGFGVPAEVIHLELLETGVMENSEKSLYELNQLHNLGIKLAIDDFGTGYSSLDYLRRLPIDVIKVDKSFVQGIGNNHHDEEIIRVIIAVAQTMGIEVVAEGVETQEQLWFLKKCDCDMAQGYLFSAEKDSYAFTEHLKENIEIVADGSLPISPSRVVAIK